MNLSYAPLELSIWTESTGLSSPEQWKAGISNSGLSSDLLFAACTSVASVDFGRYITSY